MAASMMNGMDLLQEPAYCRLKLDTTVKLEKALERGKDGLTMLSYHQSLHEELLKETKLIRTIISGRCAQLRREKSMQLLKRVKACLQRVSCMNRLFTIGSDLLNDINTFLSGAECGYLPCKQSWTYLLYLISQYYQLLHRTTEYSLSTFQFICCDLGIRHLVQVKIVFMAISARVWQVCRALADKLADVYNLLFPIQQNMEAALSDWKYPDLPKELLREQPQSNDNQQRLLETCSDSEQSVSDIDIASRIEEYTSLPTDLSSCLPVSETFDQEEDLGVAVSITRKEKAPKRKAEHIEMESSPLSKKNKTDGRKARESKKKEKNKKNSMKILFSDDSLPKKKMKNQEDHGVETYNSESSHRGSMLDDMDDKSGNLQGKKKAKKKLKDKAEYEVTSTLLLGNKKNSESKKKKKKKMKHVQDSEKNTFLSTKKSINNNNNIILGEPVKRKKKKVVKKEGK